MKIAILGYEIEIRGRGETQGKKLAKAGTEARQRRAWEKIERAVEEIIARGENPSEYRIRKYSGVSINTVKRYRPKIAQKLAERA